MALRAYREAECEAAKCTRAVRSRIMKEFMAFAVGKGVRDYQSTGALLAYIQQLVESDLTFRTIRNYISALKANYLRLGWPIQAFDNIRVKDLFKRLSKKKPSRVIPKGVFTVTQLHTFFLINNSYPDHIPYALAYSLAVFGFLRISNLAPPSESTFDGEKQLTMADIRLQQDALVINLKWAKNLQRTDQHHIIKVPRLPNRHAMCPVMAFLRRRHPTDTPSSPLIAARQGPLTEKRLRERMALVLARMKLSNEGLTFHSFRRTGVTITFSNNVPLQAIRAHGAWASDAAWQYVKHTDKITSKHRPCIVLVLF